MAQLLPMSRRDDRLVAAAPPGSRARPARAHALGRRGRGRARSRWCPDRRPRGPCESSSCAQRDLVVVRSRSLRSSRPASPAVAESCARICSATCLGVAADADRDRLGQADAVGVDVDLDDLRVLRPVVDAVAGQRRERVEPGAERQHDVGLGDQLHRRLRAVVAERADGERMRAGEGVVVLVVAADRRVEPLGERRRSRRCAPPMHHAGAVQDDRELRLRQQLGRLRDRARRRRPGARTRRSPAARCRSPGSSSRAAC